MTVNIPRSTYAVLLTLSIFLAGGCGGGVLRLADDPLILDVAGPVEIDVESFNGDVTIETDSEVEWATVRVTRAVTRGHTRFPEVHDDLAQINYSVHMAAGEIGPKLQVRTMTDGPEPDIHRAHVHIVVPETDRIYVRTTNGDVRAIGVSGPIDVRTTNGDVRIMTAKPMRNTVTIVNNNGNIDYRVRSESTGRIDAETVDGRVIHRIRRGHFIVSPGTGHRRLYATLNRGQNPITLRTVGGDIRLAVVENPQSAIGTFFLD